MPHLLKWPATYFIQTRLDETVKFDVFRSHKKMALTNILLVSQIAGYVIALILSLCITVPMSLHQDEFR